MQVPIQVIADISVPGGHELIDPPQQPLDPVAPQRGQGDGAAAGHPLVQGRLVEEIDTEGGRRVPDGDDPRGLAPSPGARQRRPADDQAGD